MQNSVVHEKISSSNHSHTNTYVEISAEDAVSMLTEKRAKNALEGKGQLFYHQTGHVTQNGETVNGRAVTYACDEAFCGFSVEPMFKWSVTGNNL